MRSRDGGAEAFGETDAEGVAVLGELGFGNVGGGGGVPESGAVHVKGQAIFFCGGGEVGEGGEGPDGAGAFVVGVFDAD